MTAALALAAVLANAAPASPAPAPADTRFVAYTVKAGDTLYSLGQAWLNASADYRRVQRDNRIADPRRIAVGHVLRIDQSLLKTRPVQARVAAVTGAARLDLNGRSAPLDVGQAFGEGARISTGPGAFVTFDLPDESRVTLPSESSIRVVRLREILINQATQRVFVLDRGRSAIVATPDGNPAATFQVRTPISVSAVRGTEFRVGFAESETRATTEVIKGGVGVAADAAPAREVLTPQGFGIAAAATQLGGLQALLPPPTVVRGGRDQGDAAVSFTAQPLAGAARFRFQIASDAGFIDVVAEAEAAPDAQGGSSVSFATVPNGSYFLRATAIDASGLEGLPAAYGFQRDLNTLDAGEPASERSGKQRRYLFRWSAAGDGVRTYRFQLFAAAAPTVPIVDVPGLDEPRLSVTDLPPGGYDWRVIAVRFKDGVFTEKIGATQTLTVGE